MLEQYGKNIVYWLFLFDFLLFLRHVKRDTNIYRLFNLHASKNIDKRQLPVRWKEKIGLSYALFYLPTSSYSFIRENRLIHASSFFYTHPIQVTFVAWAIYKKHYLLACFICFFVLKITCKWSIIQWSRQLTRVTSIYL